MPGKSDLPLPSPGRERGSSTTNGTRSASRFGHSHLAPVFLLVILVHVSTTTGKGNPAAFTGALAAGPGIANHPVGIIPSDAVAIPSDWPLDDRGAVMCLTCHTEIPESTRDSEPRLRESGPEGIEPTEFCARCHGQPLKRKAESLHWLAVGVAHVSQDQRTELSGNTPLDARTRACLSCHDGAIASESKNGTPWNRPQMYLGDKRRNHPVGIAYNDVSRPKDLSPLRPAGLLPPNVELPQGRVTCVSCHNLYSRTRYRLTVPIHGSELCLTCHDMR